MKRIISLIICLLIMLNYITFTAHASVDEGTNDETTNTGNNAIGTNSLEINAKSAVLMDADTGLVLYTKNASEALPPASVTKIMTLLLVAEAIDRGSISLDDKVYVSANAASKGGSQIFIKEGEEFSVEELLKSTVIASANDAAVALAELLAGTEDAFVVKMNERAKSLGMTNIVCFMPYQLAGMRKQTEKEKLLNFDIDAVCSMSYVDNIGTDPYWYGADTSLSTDRIMSPYEYNYNATKLCLEKANQYGKDHNIWIQGYGAPAGREEEIIEATEAVYDAGARTVLSWSYRAAESHSYRSTNIEKSWFCTVEGLKRIKSMDRDRILAENRKKYMK